MVLYKPYKLITRDLRRFKANPLDVTFFEIELCKLETDATDPTSMFLISYDKSRVWVTRNPLRFGFFKLVDNSFEVFNVIDETEKEEIRFDKD